MLKRIVTSIAVIMLLAFAIRIAVYWSAELDARLANNTYQPFGYETGRIAKSIAEGHGFSSPLSIETGPSAWLTPVFPYLLAGIFKLFGVYSYKT